jgi:hypothetical protein
MILSHQEEDRVAEAGLEDILSNKMYNYINHSELICSE